MWVNRSDSPWVPQDELSRGPETGFMENYVAAVDDQMVGRSMLAVQSNFGELDRKNAKLIKELTGDSSFFDVFGHEYKSMAEEFEGTPDPLWASEEFRQKNLSRRQRLEELKKQYPQIKTYDEIWQDVKKYAKRTEEEYADISARATGWGAVGGFVGSAAGSMTYRDPLNLATLGVGGVGKTALMRIGTEGAAQGAVEAVNQLTGVADSRRLMGLENSTSDKLMAIGGAAIGGAALRGIGEGGAYAIDRIPQTDWYKKASASTRNVYNSVIGRRPSSADPVESLLDATEMIESSGNPNARSTTSTASGAYGMTEDTFLSLVRRNNPEMANLSDAEVLQKRFDRDFSRQKARELHQDNARQLQAAGVDVTPENLRVTYFLGGPDGVKVLKADPSTPVEKLLKPHVIEANEKLLRGKTAGEVIAHEAKLVGVQPVSTRALVDAIDESGVNLTPTQRGALERLRRTADEEELLPSLSDRQRLMDIELKLDSGQPVTRADLNDADFAERVTNSDLVKNDRTLVNVGNEGFIKDAMIKAGLGAETHTLHLGDNLVDIEKKFGIDLEQVRNISYKKLKGSVDGGLTKESKYRSREPGRDVEYHEARLGDTVKRIEPTQSIRGIEDKSWVVREKETGRPVFETYQRSVAEKVNTDKYEVVPIGKYLADLNAKIKSGGEGSVPRPLSPEAVEKTAEQVKNIKVDAAKAQLKALKDKAKGKLEKADAMLYAEPVVDEKGRVSMESRKPSDLLAELEEDEAALKAMKECSL